ncbi:MAG: hypothetical protein ABH886_00380 [Candidatus Desantisbacteria bacterium]
MSIIQQEEFISLLDQIIFVKQNYPLAVIVADQFCHLTSEELAVLFDKFVAVLCEKIRRYYGI